MTEQGKGIQVLIMNTLAFTVCFAAWMMNGVLITFLVDNGLFSWDKAQMGWLIGIPVLTGSLTRLPIGILTDKYGGRIVYATLMLLSAIPMFMVSYADTYYKFLFAGLGFGLTGASFAVGIAYTSVWFKKERQGTAIGIFGAGNAGAALTSMAAPFVLHWLTDNGTNLEGWRMLPRMYAAGLVLMAILFFLLTHTKLAGHSQGYTLRQRLEPLKHMRVWRFGAYYFLVFGGFVALAQWLIPYYVNVYSVTIASAGLLAAVFSLPSGVIRALGGWMSDVWGARFVMYLTFVVSLVVLFIMSYPETSYTVKGIPNADGSERLIEFSFGIPLYLFVFLSVILGFVMSLGKAAVYKHIPVYFPDNVGAVGGLVGMIGGLGGFVLPISFGILLDVFHVWSGVFMLMFLIVAVSTIWMHLAIRKMDREQHPELRGQKHLSDVPH